MELLEYGKAICYSGYRAGQSPKTVAPSLEEIKEDIEILAKDGYKYLRMYDPNIHARRVLQVIHENNLPIKCMIGIDSDNEINNKGCAFEDQQYTEEELQQHKDRNSREVDLLIELVNEYPDEVFAVSVGNENTPPWGAHMVSEERLIEHAKKLKAGTGKPVTFCEGYFEWLELKELPKYMDIISVHSYPYHYGTPTAESVALNKAHYEEIKALFPDKQVIFTEVGWSTNSPQRDYHALIGTEMEMVTPAADEPKRASLEVAKAYIEELVDWMDKDQVIGFIFEAFDEPWKGDSLEASECNFGLYTVDRVKKW